MAINWTKVIGAAAGALGASTAIPDSAYASPLDVIVRGAKKLFVKNPTGSEALRFLDETPYQVMRGIHDIPERGGHTYIWDASILHDWGRDALGIPKGEGTQLFFNNENRAAAKDFFNNNKGVAALGGVAAAGVAGAAIPDVANANTEALQEPTFDPTTLLAGPIRWGGGLANMAISAGVNWMSNKASEPPAIPVPRYFSQNADNEAATGFSFREEE
jgi:hypothetical protein